MSAAANLLALDLRSAARAVAAGELDPVELATAYLERIEALDPVLRCYTTLNPERALAQARATRDRVARGEPPGALSGVPLGVKDLFDTAGLRTTYGSAVYREHVPDRDATVVARLGAAGATLLGKHATHELAWGGTTTNAHFGATGNPHDPTRIPGGSSGGSAAAVVAGLALASVGTDTCGSVRIPAALCGCVGLKPTFGRVSLAGAMPLARSLDHAGPIARTVADAAAMLAVLAGPDPSDLRTLPDPLPDLDAALAAGPGARRVGRLRGWFEEHLDPEVRAGVDRAEATLAGMGCEVVDLVPPAPDDVVAAAFARVHAEARPMHAAAWARTPDLFGPELAELLARPVPTPAELARTEAELAEQVRWVHAALADCDLLLSATVPTTAPEIGARSVCVDGHRMHIEWALTRLTTLFDVAGLPALTLPAPEATRSDALPPAGPGDPALAGPPALPVGVQLVGRRLDEASVLAAGQALERAWADPRGWAPVSPPTPP